MDAHLREIVARGGPAQSAEAELLMRLLAADPTDPHATAAAQDLIDAYLNDPDLVR